MVHVRLRPYVESDAVLMFEAARESVKEAHPWMPWCHPTYQLSEAQDWIRNQIRLFADSAEYMFVMESDSGLYLGGCGLNQINSEHRCANLGYWVRSSRVGRGIATHAVKLLAEWAFSHTNLVRLEILSAVDNKPSQRVAESAGAVREGVLRKRLQIHGVWHDAVVFSITRAPRPAA